MHCISQCVRSMKTFFESFLDLMIVGFSLDFRPFLFSSYSFCRYIFSYQRICQSVWGAKSHRIHNSEIGSSRRSDVGVLVFPTTLRSESCKCIFSRSETYGEWNLRRMTIRKQTYISRRDLAKRREPSRNFTIINPKAMAFKNKHACKIHCLTCTCSI